MDGEEFLEEFDDFEERKLDENDSRKKAEDF